MRRDGGFTLLEVLVAFVIAAIALAALFSGGLGGLRAAAVSASYTEAVTRAQSHLATAADDGSLTSSDRQGDEGHGYHWHVRVTPSDVGKSAAGIARNARVLALYVIRASESWTEDGRARSVELDTMRAATAPLSPP